MPTYVRVRDTTTGHEFDLDDRIPRRGVVEIDGYPPNSGDGALPRPSKHRVTKAGRRGDRINQPPAINATAPAQEGAPTS